MKRYLILPLILFALGACRGPVSPPASSSGERQSVDAAAIRTLVADFVRLYNAGDSDKLLSVFYADDAVMISPTGAHEGKRAILVSVQTDLRDNDEHIDTSVVEDLRVSGDLAVARGVDTGTTGRKGAARPAPYRVNWVMAFARQSDGTWKCVDEIWTEAPPSGAPRKP